MKFRQACRNPVGAKAFEPTKAGLFAGLDPSIEFVKVPAVASAGDDDRRANQQPGQPPHHDPLSQV
jgi:hypothetical protein